MTCTVKVTNGTVPLPPGVQLPEGAEVQLTIPDAVEDASFGKRYAAYIGAVTDMPADLSENIDHYVHGHRKK